MKQQTAVEWLQEVYNQQGRIFAVQFEQAKEMERQQIIEARQSHPLQMQKLGWRVCVNDGEQYFNETYGG